MQDLNRPRELRAVEAPGACPALAERQRAAQAEVRMPVEAHRPAVCPARAGFLKRERVRLRSPSMARHVPDPLDRARSETMPFQIAERRRAVRTASGQLRRRLRSARSSRRAARQPRRMDRAQRPTLWPVPILTPTVVAPPVAMPPVALSSAAGSHKDQVCGDARTRHAGSPLVRRSHRIGEPHAISPRGRRACRTPAA